MTGGRDPVSVGIDLLEIERLERALDRRPRLAMRLFTDDERAYAASRARPGQHLAARFCAKEAVAKALELEAWSFRDIEVTSAGGPPQVTLHGAVQQRDAIRVVGRSFHAQGERKLNLNTVAALPHVWPVSGFPRQLFGADNWLSVPPSPRENSAIEPVEPMLGDPDV